MAIKRWSVLLEESHIEWAQAVQQESGVSVGAILGRLIEREMKDKTSSLRNDLVQTKLQVELQKLNDAQMEIEMKRNALTKQLKTGRQLQTA